MNRSALWLLALLSLAACRPAAETDTPAAETGADSSTVQMGHAGMSGHGASSYSDLTFLDGMMAHHQMALDMAEAADARAGSDAVRTLGREIAAAQRAEIDSMRAWRARWFAGAPTPGPMSADDMADMGMAGMDMEGLAAARGAAFDRMFYEQMIPHHAGAVTMAAEAQVRSERPEIRALARAIIAAQAEEIGEMQARLDATSPAAPR
ncbi:MAG TPA: DUF305 domain-containing protein [Rubricoccaceae bacterium]|jgi:uncharacterized protein (DUF305 family)